MTELSFALGALLVLGAFHGLNPGMGWLFAVALGLQERRRSAVWRSLLPLAAGHAAAVAVAIAAIALAGQLISLAWLKWAVAAVLLLFATYRLFRHGHPRYGGMRVNGRDLTVWSFLMASAHGAGLMVLPFIFGTTALHERAEVDPLPAGHHAHHQMEEMSLRHDRLPEVTTVSASEHAGHAASLLPALPAGPVVGLFATLVHTAGYLFMMGLLAVVVYEKVGLRMLRKAWVNLDFIWIAALILTAVLTVAL